uniref:Pleckstrin homology domain containing S1, tandem duplicate 3 n=1 Tax=Labrus bergylta TaxID=56723 RepID=A0A3Q3EEE0_9LABR
AFLLLSGGNAVFYRPVGGAKEIRSGYLFKSPPQKRLKAEKSWKRRYFVLFKISEQEHQLKYFRSPQKRTDHLEGSIYHSIISLLYVNPENHQRWGWVQKSFKCSPSCVLYIRVADRDYFLVGECRSVRFYCCCFFLTGRNLKLHYTLQCILLHCIIKTPNVKNHQCNLKVFSVNHLDRRECQVSRVQKVKNTNHNLKLWLFFSFSLDTITPEEREFEMKVADLKKHLTLTEVDGKPSVSGWTGQPQSVCLFHKEDQILAINDLHTCSVDEFNMFLSKSLKSEVKVTILRLPGCLPLHSPNIPCID